jgi:hypothetical protein
MYLSDFDVNWNCIIYEQMFFWELGYRKPERKQVREKELSKIV